MRTVDQPLFGSIKRVADQKLLVRFGEIFSTSLAVRCLTPSVSCCWCRW